jgi:hypothetical protein
MPKFNSIQEMWENYIEAAIEQRNLLALKVGRRAVEGLCDSVAYQLAIAATRDLTNDDMAPLIASSPRLLNMQYQGNTNLGTSPSIGRIFASCLQNDLERDIRNAWRSREMPVPDEATESGDRDNRC